VERVCPILSIILVLRRGAGGAASAGIADFAASGWVRSVQPVVPPALFLNNLLFSLGTGCGALDLVCMYIYYREKINSHMDSTSTGMGNDFTTNL
jgi:hypothetical protein